MKLTLDNPRSLNAGVLQIAEKMSEELSPYTLKRLIKSRGYVWKRMRRCSRDKRNEADFQTAKAHLDKLRTECATSNRDFDLIYFDAAGFTLTPSVPYAWQQRGQTLEILSEHSSRLNVLGFLNLNGAFQSYVFQGTIDSAAVINCSDDFCRRMKRPALIVLDNAPIHTRKEIKANIQRWEDQGLYLLFLPPYCPELNLIKIL